MARRLSVLLALALALAVPAPALAASPVTFPGPPTVVDVWPTRVTLTWQPPNTTPLVTYYRIYRVSGGQETFVNASYGTSIMLALLTPDTQYTYFVETGDQTSNGVRSPALTFRTPRAPAETAPPTTPGAFRATSVEANRATLAWSPSTDNFGIAAYNVYRTRQDGRVESAGGTITETQWTRERLLPDFDYRYHIVAQDHSGNVSAPSPPVTFRTPPHPLTTCAARSTATTITLSNTGVGLDVYTIRFTLAPGQTFTLSFDLAWHQVGNEVVLWYEGWAGGLGRGTRTFQIITSGPAAPPTAIRLNGQPCAPL
ncbi:fibronectin type III domain-containing protein [Phytohabitans houttuyneae]|nr:fibronectin type III domain-containing protein [Phytohabitans houttuyneae]